jgi:hypothetical protein
MSRCPSVGRCPLRSNRVQDLVDALGASPDHDSEVGLDEQPVQRQALARALAGGLDQAKPELGDSAVKSRKTRDLAQLRTWLLAEWSFSVSCTTEVSTGILPLGR